MYYTLPIVLISTFLYSSSAYAYVGPGLIVMGNIFGPLLIFIPFLLLLVFFALRWGVKKMRRQLGTKNSNRDDVHCDDHAGEDKNSAD
tara:strand:- start:134087 stop:134350 length:264 start_codon:yes stop_codon:yes gene_type:complete